MMDQSGDKGRLERVRRSLFQRVEEMRGPRDWLAVQWRIAAAVIRAEKAREKASKEFRSYLKWHIQLCRAYGDVLAWRCLDPHAIRQHATLPGRPPHLGGLRNQLLRYFQIAKPYANLGLPVLIPDLTNSLRLGDVIVVIDPSAPDVIEVKCSDVILPSRLARIWEDRSSSVESQIESYDPPRIGRLGRQISNIVTRTRYLQEDEGQLFGDDFTRHAITVNVEPKTLHAGVESATLEALEKGMGFWRQGPHAILAVTPDAWDDNPPPVVKQLVAEMDVPVAEMNLRPSNGFWWVAAPPTEWDLSWEAAWALMDGDVLLAHIVDLQEVERCSDEEYRFLVEAGEGFPSIIVRHDGHELVIGEKFVWDVLYGFEGIHSMVARAKAFVRRSLDEGPDLLGELSKIEGDDEW